MMLLCPRAILLIPLCALGLRVAAGSAAGQAWQPAGDNLKTRWARQVQPDHVLPEYPRPELERARWQNLNGLWDYAVTDGGAAAPPRAWQGKILVPFCIESSLSGVQTHVTAASCLWYH